MTNQSQLCFLLSLEGFTWEGNRLGIPGRYSVYGELGEGKLATVFQLLN